MSAARLNLSAETLDLTVTQGDAFSLVLVLTDDSDGEPLDLDGFTGRMQVRTGTVTVEWSPDKVTGTGCVLQAGSLMALRKVA